MLTGRPPGGSMIGADIPSKKVEEDLLKSFPSLCTFIHNVLNYSKTNGFLMDVFILYHGENDPKNVSGQENKVECCESRPYLSFNQIDKKIAKNRFILSVQVKLYNMYTNSSS